MESNEEIDFALASLEIIKLLEGKIRISNIDNDSQEQHTSTYFINDKGEIQHSYYSINGDIENTIAGKAFYDLIYDLYLVQVGQKELRRIKKYSLAPESNPVISDTEGYLIELINEINMHFAGKIAAQNGKRKIKIVELLEYIKEQGNTEEYHGIVEKFLGKFGTEKLPRS